MLDPAQVDLTGLCAALDDRTSGVSWWICGRSGALRKRVAGPDADRDADLQAEGWVRVRRTESYESYRDMAEFVAAVHHRRAADLLDRAISGRGAFRRFRDTLGEFPDLRDQWFRYREARAQHRAMTWLVGAGLVEEAAAARALDVLPDPDRPAPDVPAAVAVDLAILFGDRLLAVLLVDEEPAPAAHGDRATHRDRAGDPAGDRAAEVDRHGAVHRGRPVDLLVVLDGLRAPWAELARMEELLWAHSQRCGAAVTATPVGPAELAAPSSARLRRAAQGAVRVG